MNIWDGGSTRLRCCLPSINQSIAQYSCLYPTACLQVISCTAHEKSEAASLQVQLVPWRSRRRCSCCCCDATEEVAERREEFDGGRIIDISHYNREEMPAWESAGGTGEFLRLVRSMRNASDIANFRAPHSGTHVDAPGHVFDHYYHAGFDVDTLDLALLNGPALLVDVPRIIT
uniref:Cyclase family protein n=1 Tax=Oryza brachyantha TaxID=4533 RepID=J3MVK2_ORYBR